MSRDKEGDAIVQILVTHEQGNDGGTGQAVWLVLRSLRMPGGMTQHAHVLRVLTGCRRSIPSPKEELLSVVYSRPFHCIRVSYDTSRFFIIVRQ